ncbi:MAG TPA: pantoate--beta-alanine ligase [Flavisolibacter sp.]|jgi:pantoate--beta-alanine ligase|nr:pantoate--beta-alanine ligase [Flavisolibacter sp.]
MILFKQANRLSEYIDKEKKAGKRIGFVPTMGALHDGHLSLLSRSVAENETTVCSIFVNPTQFNNPDDFTHYPVTIEKDISLLESAGTTILFLPSVPEVYPEGFSKKVYPLGRLEEILEGAFRPGHFQGVCQVVDRLFEITNPDHLYMGQKDYQQCMVVQKLLELTGRTEAIQLHIEPTQRESSGLAMSSRNLRLSETQREQASYIYSVLLQIKNELPAQPLEELEKRAVAQLTELGFQVDYLQIRNARTLEAPDSREEPLVVLVAATLGSIRLIDNLILN